MKKTVIALLCIFIIALILTSCTPEAGGDPLGSTAIIGQPAPDFTLQNLDGKPITLSSFRGIPVLLNFWATWCGPCRSEMPLLQEIGNEWTEKELKVLLVNIGENPAKVRDFMITFDLSMPVLLDLDTTISATYGINAIPTTYFIDHAGTLQSRIIGAFANKSQIENELKKIIP